MYINKQDRDFLIKELEIELHAKLDGPRKNLIVPECPYCGKKGGKFGIYVGKETDKKNTSVRCVERQLVPDDISSDHRPVWVDMKY